MNKYIKKRKEEKMSDFAIGIYLGRSTSAVVAYFKDGHMEAICDSDTKSPIIPSLIAVNKKGKLLIGESARDFVDLPGHGVREVQRKMGTGEKIFLGEQEYSAEGLSALILSKLKENAEIRLGESITDVVLSVPANFNDAAKQATLHAAEIAGLNVVYLINESTAAALAFGIKNIDLEAQIVVFDFGGGTLDVTTLEMMEGVLEVKSSYGDTSLGGKDFDEAMMELVLNKFFEQNETASIINQSKNRFKELSEKAKIALSTQDSYDVYIPCFTQINGEVVDLDVEITRSEFEEKVTPLLERARECLKRALEGGKFKPSSIDKILLVGGTTYMPCVRNLVSEFFGKEVKLEVDPDMAVAYGASIKAGMEKVFMNTKNNKSKCSTSLRNN